MVGGATGTVQPISVNFHLTKDDAYATSSYGAWSQGPTNYPSPATEFGAVVAVFRGVPNVVTSPTQVGDKTAIAIASGPDATYLTYVGTTSGAMSMPGFLGGISGCGADGSTNQVLFTFRPSSDARLVFDAAESGFGTTISLHEGLPSALPKNPNSMDGSSAAILNTNDTFASANAVPALGTPIDGAYVERTGDTKVSTIHADYTATTQLWVNGERSQNSNLIAKLSSTAGLYVGMQLSDSTNWAGTPVVITALNGTTATMSANWLDIEDDVPTPIAFDDSLVGCAADPSSQDAVYKFDVSVPRRVRIDTEGSNFDTVLSLHDAPPPQIITKNDVALNPLVPGYVIGDVTNGSYTVSDIATGTSALPNSYDYVQCGAVKTARDAAFKFQLSKSTHLGLEVSSASWNPIVALFASAPGSGTVLSNAANLNDSVGTAPNVPFNLGDVYGQLDTKVTGSNLTTLNDNYSPSALGCLTLAGGKDAVFAFTPSKNTTVRVEAKPLSGWLPVFGVFDGPPPASGAILTAQGFDAANVTLPDSNCLAYSFHDPATGAAPSHVYTVCPTRQYSDAANVRCTGASMDALASVNSAAEQTFLQNTSVSTTSAYRFHIGVLDSGSGFAWRDASAWSYTHWASGQPKSDKCVDMAQDGTWQVGKCSGSSSPDNAYYICEDSTPSVAPNEDAATASLIDPSGTVINVQGSTRRMYSDYNGAVLLGACGGTISAGDAVFKITTGTSGGFPLSVDSAGSSYSAVLGLFDGTIDAAGYKTCSASGTPLAYTLLSSRTYYVVVKGTASSPEGNYKIKFAKSTAPASGSRLACAAGTSGAPTATVDVDVDANHTYYVVVDQLDRAARCFRLQRPRALPNAGRGRQRRRHQRERQLGGRTAGSVPLADQRGRHDHRRHGRGLRDRVQRDVQRQRCRARRRLQVSPLAGHRRQDRCDPPGLWTDDAGDRRVRWPARFGSRGPRLDRRRQSERDADQCSGRLVRRRGARVSR